jgi:hypothetical protein
MDNLYYLDLEMGLFGYGMPLLVKILVHYLDAISQFILYHLALMGDI